jgi:hypothetical protein
MKKLLLLGLPLFAVAGLQVWSQALAEPAPVYRPGIVVPGVTVASPAAGMQGPPGSFLLPGGAAALTGTSDHGGTDGR